MAIEDGQVWNRLIRLNFTVECDESDETNNKFC